MLHSEDNLIIDCYRNLFINQTYIAKYMNDETKIKI